MKINISLPTLVQSVGVNSLSSIFHMRWGFLDHDWCFPNVFSTFPARLTNTAKDSFIKSLGCFPSCFSSIFVFVTTSLKKKRNLFSAFSQSGNLFNSRNHNLSAFAWVWTYLSGRARKNKGNFECEFISHFRQLTYQINLVKKLNWK